MAVDKGRVRLIYCYTDMIDIDIMSIFGRDTYFMLDDTIPRSILVLVLVLLGGFFAGSETALSNCNRVRMKSRAEDGEAGPARVEKILTRFDKALVTILVGNNVVHVLATSTATVLAILWFGSYGTLISTVVMTLVVFIFSETIPKNFAKANADAFAIGVSGPLYALMVVLTPVAAVFTAMSNALKKLFKGNEDEVAMTEDDFKSMIETIEDEGALESEESELIQSALEFSDLTAYNVLTPRVHITGIDLSDPEEVNREKIRQTTLSRLPVYDPDLDHIVGILNTKAYLLQVLQTGSCDIAGLMAKPYTAPATVDIYTLFQEMCKRKQHMVIILDEWGGTLGLVTMEDILESLVGDIWDEEASAGKAPPPGGGESPAGDGRPESAGDSGEVAK